MTKYGIFVDAKVMTNSDQDWDNMMIGAHAHIRRQQREMSKTASGEYYRITNGKTCIIEYPMTIEKLIARILYVFSFKKNKIVGYRSESVRM